MINTVKYPLVLFCVTAAAGLALSATFALTFTTIQQKEKQKETQAIISSFWNVETPEGAAWENYARLDGTGVYAAYADPARKKVLGYAAQGSAAGYSSTIKLMAGAVPLGGGRYRILGVKVISQQETPGLGARMNDTFTSDTLWTAIAAVFGAEQQEEPVDARAVEQAAEALGVQPQDFPVRPAFQDQFAGKIVIVKGEKATGIELNKMGWEKVAMGEFPEDDRTVVAMTGATISSKAVVNAVYDAVKTIHNAVASSDAANSPAPGN